jgi:hypothetical protein
MSLSGSPAKASGTVFSAVILFSSCEEQMHRPAGKEKGGWRSSF